MMELPGKNRMYIALDRYDFGWRHEDIRLVVGALAGGATVERIGQALGRPTLEVELLVRSLREDGYMEQRHRAAPLHLRPPRPRERDTLEHIRRLVAAEGRFPSSIELGRAMGIAPQTAHTYCVRLARKGYLERTEERTRNFRLVEGEGA